MTDEPALVYLESDDEITAVVRRLRAADAERVIVVAPGRSRATSSAVALRLLARAADDEGRAVSVVGDELTRSLAVEAGLPAYRSVEDARAARAPEDAAQAPRHAAIHVVRGKPEVAAGTTATAIPTAALPRALPSSDGDETRAVPITRPARPPRPRPQRRRSLGLAAVLGVAAALLVIGVVAAATLLPAATITITPRLIPVSATYQIVVSEPERNDDTVEATATVVATGRYEELEPARGVVTFFNYNGTDVEVPAETLVAAGVQAFETTEAVVVPPGSLTAEGTIAGGEEDAPVVAVAPGPDANVLAMEIDTVLSQNTAARLRLFPGNEAMLVRNAEPTAGGTDETGTEITQADVDAAVESLRAELRRLAEEATPELGDRLALRGDAAEPVIDLPDGLVGTRDSAEVEISGSLDWELVVIDPGLLEEDAAGRLATDPGLPADHDLLPDSTRVTLGEPREEETEIVVDARVEGVARPRLDAAGLKARVIGLDEAEVRLALADLGDVEITLWPGWVAAVPEAEWRIDVRIAEPEPEPGG